MAIQRRFPVKHADAFPKGVILKDEVRPVLDFQAEKRADGSRPQQRDKESGELLWEVRVIDLDGESGKGDEGVSVKIAAPHQPVPPSPTQVPGLGPMTILEFVGLTALPYVGEVITERDGKQFRRHVIAWSFRAKGVCRPGEADKLVEGKPGEKAAA